MDLNDLVLFDRLEVIRNIIKSYGEDKFYISFSGGKDSTAAVQLVWLAIEQLPEADRKKQIIIMNTDTLVESPVVSKWVEKSLEAMKDESTKKKLPFVPERLTP